MSPYLSNTIMQIRVMLNDIDECDYTYSDTRLTKLFLISACNILPNLTTDSYEIDLEQLTISPEPDKKLTNLIMLKSTCLLAKGETKVSAGCSVKIIDGPSTIDTGDIYKANKEMAESFCDQYEKEKAEYKLISSQGCSSVTPIKTNCCNRYI